MTTESHGRFIYIKIDPDGDTLITLQHTPPPPSYPAHLAKKKFTPGTQFLVSKTHLTLSSRRARRALGGHFTEAVPAQDGLFHWDFEPVFDPRAFEVVMRILHGQTRDVPATVDFVLLGRITAVVDDLECRDAVWFFAKTWLEHVRRVPVPTPICGDLMRWILFSSVFEEPEIFSKATANAIKMSECDMPTFNHPIHPNILEGIETKRQVLLGNLFDRLSNLESRLRDKSLGCNHACRAQMLATLEKGVGSTPLSPLPLPPYRGFGLSTTLYHLKRIKPTESHCDEQDGAGRTETLEGNNKTPSRRRRIGWIAWVERKALPQLVPGRHRCPLEDDLKAVLDASYAEIEGLELAHYVRVQARKI
ncbi:hypothetical protein V8C35DRAFT_298084 [Trichoderma chlorosporum]